MLRYLGIPGISPIICYIFKKQVVLGLIVGIFFGISGYKCVSTKKPPYHKSVHSHLYKGIAFPH